VDRNDLASVGVMGRCDWGASGRVAKYIT